MIWRVRFVRRGSGDSYVTLVYADKANTSLREVELQNLLYTDSKDYLHYHSFIYLVL